MAGVGRRMPWTMGAFAIGALSMIGVPPTAGFLGKWFILQGAYETEKWIAVGVVILSTGLNAAYFLPIVFSAFFEKERPEHVGEHGDHGEAPLPIVIALTLTAIGTVALFLFPDTLVFLAQSMVDGGAMVEGVPDPDMLADPGGVGSDTAVGTEAAPAEEEAQ